MKYIVVGAAGVIGALLRYFLGLINRHMLFRLRHGWQIWSAVSFLHFLAFI
ncbi:hypothetical protein [Ectobacillus panaciterrae]|uniref:hypothetical protein n=1 Tax=Ectobacillus panaciterrae TaxID=363872 RepID=UPI0003FD18EA|nr:hypothetical protein [Ectobacillus panaciterrae]